MRHPSRRGGVSAVARRPPARSRSRLRKVLRLLLLAAAAALLASVAAVLVLRFLPPVTSAMMVERWIEAKWQGRRYDTRYQWVSWTRVAPWAPLAAVAAEDQRFAEHHGFDLESIQDALDDAERGRRLRGASTISQQVAKNLFLWSGRSYLRKGLEAYFTTLIEALWPKRRILEVYVNIAEMGDGVFGVEAASQRFFRKPASRVRADEAALLAAVLPNPHRFRVDRPSPYVLDRQAWILRQMDQIGGTEYLKRF
jgi:monofunctional biosynthetic peptidoglycan transglycosylase